MRPRQGFAPIIATALFAEFQSSMPIAIYLFTMCAISLACTAVLSLRSRAAATGRVTPA